MWSYVSNKEPLCLPVYTVRLRVGGCGVCVCGGGGGVLSVESSQACENIPLWLSLLLLVFFFLPVHLLTFHLLLCLVIILIIITSQTLGCRPAQSLELTLGSHKMQQEVYAPVQLWRAENLSYGNAAACCLRERQTIKTWTVDPQGVVSGSKLTNRDWGSIISEGLLQPPANIHIIKVTHEEPEVWVMKLQRADNLLNVLGPAQGWGGAQKVDKRWVSERRCEQRKMSEHLIHQMKRENSTNKQETEHRMRNEV